MARRNRGATRHQVKETHGVKSVFAVAAKLMLVAALLGSGAWAVQGLMDPQRFPLRSVRIDSPLQQVAQATIRETIRPHVEAGFMGVDVDGVRADLETLPWVQRATVRRAWPDRLVVRVFEQQALARWGKDSLMNREGELFRPEDAHTWQELPLLRGPRDTQRTVAEKFLAMQEMLKPLGLNITHMSLNERRALSLRLDNGLQLGLGRADSDLRLLRFVQVFAQVIKPRVAKIDSIDLRYTNGFAVRWRDGYNPASV